MGEGDCTDGAAGRAKRRESVERKTMLGETTRSRKSGVSAAIGMEGAMTVVAAVVAGLDVVVGRE